MKTMSETWTQTKGVVGDSYLSLRTLLAKSLLEHDLASIFRTVSGHKKHGAKPGDQRFQALWQTADSKVIDFCSQYHVDRMQIEAQVPALQELRNLSIMPEEHSKAVIIPASIAITIASLFVIGFASGFVHWIFTVGYRLADDLTNLLRAIL